MKKRLSFYIVFFFIVLTGFTQNRSIDNYYLIELSDLSKIEKSDSILIDTSMQHFHASKHDTSKLFWVANIIDNSWDDDIWPKYNMWALQFVSNKLTSKNLPKNLEKHYKEGKAVFLNNEGYYQNNLGNVSSALDYYHQSLNIREEINDSSGIASSFNNIGIIHDNLGETSKAKEYYFKSLNILKNIDDKLSTATAYNNLGYVYDLQNDTSKALDYYQKSLTLYEELNEGSGIATSLNNIGSIYQSKGLYDEALTYHEKSLKIRESIADKHGITFSLNNLGTIFLKKNEIAKAEQYFKNSLTLAKEIGYPISIRNASKKLSELYRSNNQFEEALEMFDLYISMKDSISNEEAQKAALQQQSKYSYEKQKALDDKEHESKLKIEIEKKQKQKIAIIAIVVILIVVLIFLYIIFNRLKFTKKQGDIIREQNQNLNTINHKIVKQKDEIVASINYAKLIQNALLPLEEYETEVLPEHFIIYKPKDIVSGDFYWFLSKADSLYIAVVDCTGHGVPGGFLTMLGTSFLNEITSTIQEITPAEILDKLREKIVKDLSQEDSKNKDGMDISLIQINKKNGSAIWAGANNPIYISRNNEILITKGNKESIGYTPSPSPFKNHEIQLLKGDCIYLFTDGYADQFGGQKGKKMGYKNFRDELLACKEKDMSNQKDHLEKFFERWRGHEEQVDDICIIGLKI